MIRPLRRRNACLVGVSWHWPNIARRFMRERSFSLFSCLAIHVSKHASREAQLHPHATPLPGLRPIYNTWMACTSLVPALPSQMSVEAAQVQVKCSGACNTSRPNVPRNREVSALLSALRALIMCTKCIVHLRTLASFVEMVCPLQETLLSSSARGCTV